MIYLATALVVLAGLPLGYALGRNWLLGFVLGPLVTAVCASAATMAMLAIGGSLLPWLVPVFLAQYAAAALLLRRPVAPLPYGTWAEARWLLLPLLPPALVVFAPPTGWDANSIWWLHAGYYAYGSRFARAAIIDPQLAFSHTDYPPLGSAPVAAVWSLYGRGDLYLAQFVSAVTTLAAIAALVYCVRQVTGWAPVALSRLVAVGVGLAAWSTAPAVVAGGEADALWSSALVGAAVLLLLGRAPLDRPWLPLLLLGVAALAKNEGLTAAVLVAVLATIRLRGERYRVGVVWLPVLAGLGWAVLVRHLGAVSDVADTADPGAVLRGDPVHLGRIAPTIGALWHLVGPLLAGAGTVAVVGAVLLRGRRERTGLGSDAWLWVLLGSYTGLLILIYVSSRTDLAWYLATSANRTCLPIALLACVSAAGWAAVAAGEQPGGPGQVGSGVARHRAPAEPRSGRRGGDRPRAPFRAARR